ncbi:SRPBCC domain-containing protein [candidate division WOR-3 bacterium]|nr:SRPBCC domain-containing protein [candidate division WOR-3 bacterium]
MNDIVHVSAELNCSPAEAFKMFTDNEKLKIWLTEEADVESKVGGKYELFWNPEEREFDSTIGCKVTALIHEKLICFQWKGPKQYSGFMNEVDPLTHVTVSFIPTDKGTTEVHLVNSGYRCSAEWQEARQWFVNMWNFAFGELTKAVNK